MTRTISISEINGKSIRITYGTTDAYNIFENAKWVLGDTQLIIAAIK